MITGDAQKEAIKELWPGFRSIELSDRWLGWEGTVKPIKTDYLVRVRYRPPLVIEQFSTKAVQPRVQVINPLLERHPDYEMGPIPHVYINDVEPTLPYLCLFSPDGNEWSVDDLLAETTFFWAAQWLLFYEGWLVTRKWKGGGRHPVTERSPKNEGKNLETV